MVTNTYWQLEKEYYAISADHDMIIRVIEHENVTRVEGEGTDNARTITDSVPYKVHEFKVHRAVLLASSTYFAKLLSADGGFPESQQDIIDLHEDNSAEGVSIWFKILHSTESTDEFTYYNFTTTSIRDVWEMLVTAHKYGFDPQTPPAKSWFEGWYATHGTANGNAEGKRWDFKDYQQLLFPCYTFDHAIGFATATKYLAYRATGHITERRPEGFEYEHLRLDANILRKPHRLDTSPSVLRRCFTEQLNAAKGRLKTILHRTLYTPIDNLLKRARCPCKAIVLYAYEQSLSNTRAWPLESAFLNQSVQNVLRDLEGFPGPEAFFPRTCGGRWCTFDFAAAVDAARAECRKYFDGLCLGKSNPYPVSALAD